MADHELYIGDNRVVLGRFPDNYFSVVNTSPPYFGKRDYGRGTESVWGGNPLCEHEWGEEYNSKLLHENRQNLDGGTLGNDDYRENLHGVGSGNACFCVKCGAWLGQLGLEPDFNLFVAHLCDVFDLIKPKLKSWGSLFVNLGDSYYGSGTGQIDTGKQGYTPEVMARNNPKIKMDYHDKCLICIPDRFKIEMINRGWICRNEIIWSKKNCMPESAGDRFTVDYEKVFFFVKNNQTEYWTHSGNFGLVTRQPAPDYFYLDLLSGERHENEPVEFTKEKITCPKCEGGGVLYGFKCDLCGGKGKVKRWQKTNYWQGHDYYFEQQFEELQESSIERNK